MQVKQIYELMNTVTGEVLGKTDLVAEDLSNVVDVGTEVFNANAMDNYVKSLVNHIGKVIFVNRAYTGRTPSVLMDGWEFGSVLEKVRADLPEATENETWDLVDGQSYDPNVFYKPTVSAKFFNSRVTFEVPVSITERQVKESFSSATQLNGFISMIYNAVDKSMTLKIDSLIMRTINNMIGETVYADYASAGISTKSGVRAINLLYLYNAANGTALTAAEAMKDTAFLKYASYEIALMTDKLASMSTMFNVGGTEKFTPKDLQHIIMLSNFAKATESYLQADTYHDEMVRLPGYETVPYWQGTGTDYSFENVSAINIKTAGGQTENVTGILCVMFDRDALAVCNQDRRVTTDYNAKAEFFNNWYKFDCSYYNDLNENFVVFFAA